MPPRSGVRLVATRIALSVLAVLTIGLGFFWQLRTGGIVEALLVPIIAVTALGRWWPRGWRPPKRLFLVALVPFAVGIVIAAISRTPLARLLFYSLLLCTLGINSFLISRRIGWSYGYPSSDDELP